MTQPEPSEEIRRLHWQCRRGMLELDHLLLRFLDLGYRELAPGTRVAFEALLRHQDQDLSDWFMGRRKPDDPSIAGLVAHVVAVAASTPQSRSKPSEFPLQPPGARRTPKP